MYLLKSKWNNERPGYFLCYFQHLKPKMNKRNGTHVVKNHLLNKLSMFFFILIYIHAYAYNQIINVGCRLYSKHFKKI